MREEFHAETINGTLVYERLYNWNTLTTNAWLPALIELVGYTGTIHTIYGTYLSAMQGLNTSTNYYVDAQGGSQFAYFQQYNASGGREAILAATNQHAVWTRSSVYAHPDRSNSFYYNGTGHSYVSETYAVHPAVRRNPPKDKNRLPKPGSL